jgi:hypothetical protein
MPQSKDKSFPLTLTVLLIFAVGFSLYAFSLGWFHPILDEHGFRQTQTAISVYWMIKEGHYLAYQTPVLGYPWSIPFEFPFFQWLVLIIYKCLPIGLDQAGRLTSIIMFYLTLLPAYFLFKVSKLDLRIFKIFTILFLLAPLNLFWARTFMIETTGIFLSTLYLALLASYLNRSRFLTFLLMTIAGSLAITTKVTIFTAFAIFGVGLVLRNWQQQFNFKINKDVLLKYGLILFSLLILFIALHFWVLFCDELKNNNPIGAFLTSHALMLWNFGSFTERFSSALWIKTIVLSSLSNTLGFWPIILLVLGIFFALFKSCHEKILFIFSLLSYLSVYLIFTNLNIRHDYYNTESAMFLILFVSLVFDLFFKKGFHKLTLLLVLLTATMQLYGYLNFYHKVAKSNTIEKREYVIGSFLNKNTSANSVIVIYGNDWSSDISYYAQRKSLAVPCWEKPNGCLNRLPHIKSFLNGQSLGAIISCSPNQIENDHHATLIIKQLTRGFSINTLNNCKIWYHRLPNN